MKKLLTTILDSPSVSILLLVAVVAMGVIWNHKVNADLAPNVPNYNWTQHKNTILICYRADCGCSIGPASWANVLSRYSVDTLVLSQRLNKPDKNLQDLSGMDAKDHVWTCLDMDKSIMDKLTPTKKMTIYLVQQGRIKHQITSLTDIEHAFREAGIQEAKNVQ